MFPARVGNFLPVSNHNSASRKQKKSGCSGKSPVWVKPRGYGRPNVGDIMRHGGGATSGGSVELMKLYGCRVESSGVREVATMWSPMSGIGRMLESVNLWSQGGITEC